MKCVEYIDCKNIIIEFQDDYKARVHGTWHRFIDGNIRNPYAPSLLGVGLVGQKYRTVYINDNGKLVHTKEYLTWRNMLIRCYDPTYKKKFTTYQDVICCKEWLNYENFYEWLHSQENFDKWYALYKSALDKDILKKGNKLYSPNTCCLVPYYVNSLCIKRDADRGEYCIGVYCDKTRYGGYYYVASCSVNGNQIRIGAYKTQEEAFCAYKQFKEKEIKRIAEQEYIKGNITKRCYEAMMRYEVEITD